LNQRIDIFEEEIIKRVREIQKYSKGLNTLIRKTIMPDIDRINGKMSQGLGGKIQESGPTIEEIDEIRDI